jgi:hypothetical protein
MLGERFVIHFIILVKKFGFKLKNPVMSFDVNSKYNRVYCEKYYTCSIHAALVSFLEIVNTKETMFIP